MREIWAFYLPLKSEDEVWFQSGDAQWLQVKWRLPLAFVFQMYDTETVFNYDISVRYQGISGNTGTYCKKSSSVHCDCGTSDFEKCTLHIYTSHISSKTKLTHHSLIWSWNRRSWQILPKTKRILHSLKRISRMLEKKDLTLKLRKIKRSQLICSDLSFRGTPLHF